MKKILLMSLLAIGVLTMTGCSGGSSDEPTGSTTNPPSDSAKSIQGIAQLGILKNATVEIFKVTYDSNARFEKLFTETTSDGDIDSAGRFNTHSAELEDERYYVYQVSGGIDIDADDNGVEDELPVVNQGTFRAVIKGSWIKGMPDDTFRVTAISEDLYQKCYNEIASTQFSRSLSVEYWANWYSTKMLESDLNGDDVIDTKDILIFNPINDMSSLSQLEKDKYPLIVNDIHMQKNSYAIHLLNMYALISPLQKVDYLQSMPEVYHSRLSADSKTLYKVGGDFFSIMNVSNPLNIYNIGSLRFPDGAGWNFTLSHDYQTAYMVDNMHGLTVIDISNTAEPQTVKVFSLGLTGSMVVSNDNKVLYVSGNREGLKILDVNNSTDPKLLKEYMFDHLGNTANVTSMAFTSDNSVLYVTTTGKGLVALDVSDPANPTEISNIEMSYPIEIVISHDDKIAYVLDEYDGINAIDISDKNNLKILSSITHDPANSITISHDSEKLFVSGINGGIRVYDIKNPSSPIILDDDTYIDGLSSPVNSTVSHDGTMLYLSGGSLSWMSVYSLGIHTDTIK